MIKDKSTVLILGISIVEDIIAITTLGIFQSVVTNEGNLQKSCPLAIVIASIGSTLFLGSRYVPTIIDKNRQDAGLRTDFNCDS